MLAARLRDGGRQRQQQQQRSQAPTLVAGAASLLHDGGGDAALVVTAHPDDEAMFFSPAILALREAGLRLQLLCLSTGDYEGLGAVRSKELVRACASLGLPASAVAVLDDARLRDGPRCE